MLASCRLYQDLEVLGDGGRFEVVQLRVCDGFWIGWDGIWWCLKDAWWTIKERTKRYRVKKAFGTSQGKEECASTMVYIFKRKMIEMKMTQNY